MLQAESLLHTSKALCRTVNLAELRTILPLRREASWSAALLCRFFTNLRVLINSNAFAQASHLMLPRPLGPKYLYAASFCTHASHHTTPAHRLGSGWKD